MTSRLSWRFAVRYILFLIAILAVSAFGGQPPAKAGFASTAKRLARGRYLVNSVGRCFDCHSELDDKGNVTAAMRGAGRIVPAAESGIAPPQFLVCPNITPDRETGAGAWSDAQLERAIRHGTGHDGRTLVTFMPYWAFRSLTDEDLASIVVYLRSIPAVRHALPPRRLSADPQADWLPKYQPPALPGSSPEEEKRGEYLVRVGHCTGCHTAKKRGGGVMLFGGGTVFVRPWGTVASANITPDASGIAYYDRAQFARTIRSGHVGARALSATMPWHFLRRLDDPDLKAIYAYLRTLPPVQHRVDNTEPPTMCPKDGNRHGFGDRN